MPDNAEYMSMATAELTDLNNALNIANNALANLGLGPLALTPTIAATLPLIAAVQLNDPGD
jgi:hypothetical protein